ncbi:MAG: leucine-rich repeat protein, partial [Oscillospiraceae bacterium]|nr:leucine-rich repeat protein [Oscillospiraceae bacterium]
DYDSLTDEQKALCEFIFETEQSSNGRVICERARRTIAGDPNIGERITLEQLEGAYGIWDVYSTQKTGWYSYIHCVPDIRVIEEANGQNEYWLDDEGTTKVVFTGDISSRPQFDEFKIYENGKYSYSIEAEEMPFGEWMAKSPYDSYNVLDLSQAIEYNGDYYYITPSEEAVLLKNSLCGEDYTVSETPITEPHIIPDEIEGCPVVAIEEHAFTFSPYTEIVLPETIKFIDKCAFYNANYLSKINLPDGLEFLGEFALGYTAISEINLDNPDLVIGGCALSTYELEKAYINVRNIANKAFSGNFKLKNLILGDDVEIIDTFAFFGCSAIENLEIPPNVKAIGQAAFVGDEIYGVEHYSGIKSITIPPTVEIIGIVPEQKGEPFTSGIYHPPTFPLTDEPYSVFDSDCVISGWYDTEAHSYALQNNLAFKALDENIAYGDTNKDGNVDVSDLVMLQRYLIKLDDSIGYEADVNKDGRINAFDMVAVRRTVCEIS